MSSHRVSFTTIDGLTLRGDYYPISAPQTNTGHPLLIMTQGLTLLKEHYLPQWATVFQAAGIAVLLYDHRGWGSSDGSRNVIDPLQQAEDYHDAVLFAQSLDGVDKGRIGIWGIGHSGGAVMIAAGDDINIKAAVCCMPFISGEIDRKAYPEGAVERAWEERRRKAGVKRAVEEKEGVVKVWDESEEEAKGRRNGIVIHGEVPFGFIKGARESSEKAGTPWENRLTVQSLYRIAKVEPRDHIHKIEKPLLYLAAEEDPLSGPFEEQRKAFERAVGENKTFVKLEGQHLRQYFEGFENCIDVQVKWLKGNL